MTVAGRHRRHQTRGLPLRVAGAMLLSVSAGIHLDLYLTGYRTIPTIGWLFLLQFIGGFTLAIAVLVTHSRLAVAASAAFALSTLSAYLLAVWIGLFGFKEVRTRAGIAAGLIEVAAFATLALAAAAAGPARETDGWISAAARRVARVHSVVSIVIGVVGAVSILALALLGVAIANASGTPTVTGGHSVTGVEVKPGRIVGGPPIHEVQTPQRRGKCVAYVLSATVEIIVHFFEAIREAVGKGHRHKAVVKLLIRTDEILRQHTVTSDFRRGNFSARATGVKMLGDERDMIILCKIGHKLLRP